ERHNAVVGLVDRARDRGLVIKKSVAADARVVRVELTPEGARILGKLAALHRGELARFQARAGLVPLPRQKARRKNGKISRSEGPSRPARKFTSGN
ncbi:MAG: hypothetical protein ACRD4M_00675, partial [Candidatus Acidiferrales bacterium]